jgi:hypothetical protein
MQGDENDPEMKLRYSAFTQARRLGLDRSLTLIAPVVADKGDRVIAYIDQVRRLEGFVARHMPDGFAMTLVATARGQSAASASESP